MRFKIYSCYILLLVLSTFTSRAQVLSENNPLIMHVDRAYYVSGDAILFDLYLYHGLIEQNNTVPDVYIDLLTLTNVWIDGVILKQEKGMASGVLPIPDSLQNGFYQVRAYTRFPYKNSQAFIQKIYIANRFSKLVERVNNDSSFGIPVKTESKLIDLKNSEYKTRQEVTLNLKTSVKPINGSITVINRKQWMEKQKNGIKYAPIDPTVCLPENAKSYEGVIICGKVINANTQQPIPDAVVLISTEDSAIRLDYHFTNQLGEFQFHMYGCYNLQKRFFNAFTYPDFVPITNALIIIDSPFDKPQKNINPMRNFIVCESDSNEQSKSVIAKAYELQSIQFDNKPDRPTVFYEYNLLGQNFSNVNVDDFIPLNSFAEISKEILPLVKIKNSKLGPSVHVVGEYGKSNVITNNPLVLVDGVPLTKIDNILEWGSSKIKNVEVQNKQRYYGDLWLKNGIICIWTRKIDFWLQNSISGTYRYTFNGFQHQISFAGPDYHQPNHHASPDFRKILYWEPHLVINNENQKNISFNTSDEKGEFVIEFFGVDPEGKIVYDSCSFTVN